MTVLDGWPTVFDLDLGDGLVIDLVGDERYSIDRGWRPAVTERRTSVLGGRSVYADVEERIPILVTGTTTSDVTHAVEQLAEALDQAQRHESHGDVNPLVIYARAPLSDYIDSFSCMVVSGTVQLSADFRTEIRGNAATLELIFTRRGLWLGPAEQVDNVSSASSNAKGLITFESFSYTDLPSPLKLTCTFTDGAASGYTSKGYIFTARESRHLALASRFASDGADNAAASAISGYTRRCTPTSKTTFFVAPLNNLTIDPGKAYEIFIKCENNAAGITYDLFVDLSLTKNYVTTRTIRIPASSGKQIYSLGRVSALGVSTLSPGINLEASATGGAGDWLDVESLVLVAIDDASNMVAINQLPGMTSSGILELDHQQLAGHAPTIEKASSNWLASSQLDWRGDLMLQHSGEDLFMLAYMTGNNGAVWSMIDGSNASLAVTAERRRGVMVLQ